MLTNARHAGNGGYPEPQERSVGFLLMLGIIVLPYVFAWVLLNKGYSTKARIIGFAWMLIPLTIVFSQPKAGTASTAVASTAPPIAVTPEPTKPAEASPEPPWLPEGFIEVTDRFTVIKSNATLGVKMISYTDYECPSGATCMALWVVPRDGCSNLYVGAAALDTDGNNVGYTNAATASVGKGQKAKMILEYYERASRLELKELSCH